MEGGSLAISDYLKQLRAKIGNDQVFMPGVAGIVFNHENKILLQRSRDSGLWGLVGGSIDPGEAPTTSVVREILEETGIRAKVDYLIGVFTEIPTHYPNGDVTQYMAFVFQCSALDETEPFIGDDESYEVGYYNFDELPDELLARHRFYLDLAVQEKRRACFFFDEHLIE